MTIAPPAPAAPLAPASAPLRTVAPAPNVAPADPAAAQANVAIAVPPVSQFNDLAARIAAAADPAAELKHLVLAVSALIAASPDPTAELKFLVLDVASRAPDAAIQGHILHSVKAETVKTLNDVRAALLAVTADAANPNGRPGVYPGFTITQQAGARSISYKDLKENYPDVYDEMVSIGNPSYEIKYTG